MASQLRSQGGKGWGLPWGLAILFLALPFFVLFWTAPFVSESGLGQDYGLWGCPPQMELMYSLRHGTFPLYLAGFAGGASSAAAPLAQFHHPISHIAARLPGYWNGYALELLTLLRFLSLGVAHFLLFLFFRRLNLSLGLAFLLSFVAVYNLRMLDLFRYGASLENYVAFLFLSWAILWRALYRDTRWGGLWIVFSTYLLMSGGHPQMAYYGLVGAGCVALVAPLYVSHVGGEGTGRRLSGGKFYGEVAICVGVGVLLSSAIYLPFYADFLLENASRSESPYRFAVEFQDTPFGVASAFFDPFDSDVHGSFGGSALFVLALLVPLVSLTRKVPGAIWFLWLVSVAALVLALGDNTPAHYLFWKYAPFASSFRVPGRITMALPFFFALILAWVFATPEKSDTDTYPSRFATSVVVLALLAIAATGAYLVFPWDDARSVGEAGSVRHFTPAYINGHRWWYGAFSTISGFTVLALAGAWGLAGRGRSVVGVVLVAACLGQTTVYLAYGTFRGPKVETPPLSHMAAHKAASPYVEFNPGEFMWSADVDDHVRRVCGADLSVYEIQYLIDSGFPESRVAWLAEGVRAVDSREAAYAVMKDDGDRGVAVVEGKIGGKDGLTTREGLGAVTDRVVLRHNTANQLRFYVRSATGGFLVFAYPYSRGWRAYRDGEGVPVYRVNGIEQGVAVPAGESEVEFRYWSWGAVSGMLLSCVTLWGLGVWVVWRGVRRGRRVLILGAVTAAMAASMGLWMFSLYHGSDLGTRYAWTPEWRQEGWLLEAVQRYDGAVAARGRGDDEAAFALLDESFRLAPYGEAYRFYGTMLRERGEYGKAEIYFAKAATLPTKMKSWAK